MRKEITNTKNVKLPHFSSQPYSFFINRVLYNWFHSGHKKSLLLKKDQTKSVDKYNQGFDIILSKKQFYYLVKNTAYAQHLLDDFGEKNDIIIANNDFYLLTSYPKIKKALIILQSYKN